MGNRINVRNAKIVPVTVNTTEEYTLGAAIKLPGLMSIDFTPLQATGQLYGDGEMTSSITKMTGAQVKFGLNKISLEARAAMSGATITNDGILEAKTTDQPPLLAFYAETENDDKTIEQLWLLCGKTQPFGISGKQAESGITFSTDEATIDFVRREKDKLIYRLGDTSKTEFTAEKSAKFAEHPDMTA